MLNVKPFQIPTKSERAEILESYGLSERLVREKERREMTSLCRAT